MIKVNSWKTSHTLNKGKQIKNKVDFVSVDPTWCGTILKNYTHNTYMYIIITTTTRGKHWTGKCMSINLFIHKRRGANNGVYRCIWTISHLQETISAGHWSKKNWQDNKNHEISSRDMRWEMEKQEKKDDEVRKWRLPSCQQYTRRKHAVTLQKNQCWYQHWCQNFKVEDQNETVFQ